MIVAHVAGVPVEELLILAPAFSTAGLAVAAEARNRIKRPARSGPARVRRPSRLKPTSS